MLTDQQVIFFKALLVSGVINATMSICRALRDYPVGYDTIDELQYYVKHGRSSLAHSRKDACIGYAALYSIPVVVFLLPALWSVYELLTVCLVPIALLDAWSVARHNAKESRRYILKLLEQLAYERNQRSRT